MDNYAKSQEEQPPPASPAQASVATPTNSSMPPMSMLNSASPQQESQPLDGAPIDQQVAPVENGASDESVNGADEEMETDEKEEVKEEVGGVVSFRNGDYLEFI